MTVTGDSFQDPTVNFILDKKTRGILIEPVPENFQELAKHSQAERQNLLSSWHGFCAPVDEITIYAVDQKRVLKEFPKAPDCFLN